jgi:hypothetical protein
MTWPMSQTEGRANADFRVTGLGGAAGSVEAVEGRETLVGRGFSSVWGVTGLEGHGVDLGDWSLSVLEVLDGDG